MPNEGSVKLWIGHPPARLCRLLERDTVRRIFLMQIIKISALNCLILNFMIYLYTKSTWLTGGELVNAFILDVSVVTILLLFIIVGYRSGVMRSFVLFIGSIFSSIFSGYFSGKLADFVAEKMVLPNIKKQIANDISIGEFSFGNFLSNLPKFVEGSLEIYGITPLRLNHIMNSSVKQEIPTKVAELIKPVFVNIFKSIFSVLIFAVLVLSIRLIVRFASRLCKHGAINQVNSLAGGFFGALKGYLVIAVLMCCIRSLTLVMNDLPEIFSNETISSSVVFKELYFNNPVYDMFKKM